MIFAMACLALTGGVLFAIQGPVNTAVGKITNPFQATMFSFLGGTLVLTVIVSLFGTGDLRLIVGVPIWQLIGGIFGMIGVSSMVICIPHLGAGLSLMLVTLGQLLMGMLVDGFGLFEAAQIPITPLRIIGILFTMTGIFFVYYASRQNNMQQKENPPLPYAITAFASGLVSGMQSPVNGALAGNIGTWEGTLVSFSVGLLVAVIIVLIYNHGRLLPIRGVGAKPWMVIGGPLGVGGIFANISTVAVLGVVLQTTCSMVGQLGGAIVIDCFGLIGTQKIQISRYRAIGVTATALGVICVALAKR